MMLEKLKSLYNVEMITVSQRRNNVSLSTLNQRQRDNCISTSKQCHFINIKTTSEFNVERTMILG